MSQLCRVSENDKGKTSAKTSKIMKTLNRDGVPQH